MYQVNVNIPGIGNEGVDNYYVPPGGERISGGQGEIYHLLNFLNEYLWETIVVVLFFALIYGGVKLLVSGDKDGGKIIKDTVIGVGVGIMVAIFSYTIVRIITNLL